MIKYLFCLIKAIPFWVVKGVYTPHTWSDIIEHEQNIYVNEDGKIRPANTPNKVDEILVCNATVKVSVCVHCGKVKREWIVQK